MKLESIVFAAAGIFLGLVAGWLIGTRQGGPAAAPTPQAVSAPAPAPAGAAPAARPLDEAEVARLEQRVSSEPRAAEPRVALANLYFDAERYGDAITWYERALEIAPDSPDVSTDLGVSYYYTNQPDRALAQFKRSLAIDPAHTKTLLNEGIVLAFGKQDLEGAARSWQKVVELAPQSPEGQAARRALDSMRAAHPTLDAADTGSPN